MKKVEGMKRRKICESLILAVMLLFLSAFVFSGCKKGNPSRYKVVDSGMWTYPEGLEKTYWLDNERVLFVSSKNLLPEKSPKFMKIWNTTTGQVDSSHQLTGLLCVQDGQVFFTTKDDKTGELRYFKGPIDSPKEYPVPRSDMRIDDLFDCDWVPKISRANVPYKIKLKDNNYFEIIKEQRVKNSGVDYGITRYYERLDKTPVALSVDADLGNYTTRYNRLRNAYFISPTQYFPNDPYFHSLWWLQRDGTITKEPLPIPLPFIKPLSKSLPKWKPQGGLSFFPLRDGYLIRSNTGEIDSRGLYFMKSPNTAQVLLGSVHGISISPDGCRAAFIHAKNTEEYLSQTKPYRTVKTINFCEGGGKS